MTKIAWLEKGTTENYSNDEDTDRRKIVSCSSKGESNDEDRDRRKMVSCSNRGALCCEDVQHRDHEPTRCKSQSTKLGERCEERYGNAK